MPPVTYDKQLVAQAVKAFLPPCPMAAQAANPRCNIPVGGGGPFEPVRNSFKKALKVRARSALLAQDLGSQEGAHAKTGGKKRSAKTKVKISAAKKRRV
ncbi:hypothetical protein CHLRE_07g339876v5 [Chlamydomonas reinhardtii]|uniref:Uncharacterized protein n=1 Tax=Chlamydomonas reinhardtii TaxID=3055 RepID=A0A2K3DKG4_CHLRE|nr:uncharacterized protein CHLRE_07g339876v5 [Chlamydomonas reinhardtii]PNW81029.1 hypothetical protein CHLRE_07g339876v5 [Chlamydomonas reinhardtii]